MFCQKRVHTRPAFHTLSATKTRRLHKRHQTDKAGSLPRSLQHTVSSVRSQNTTNLAGKKIEGELVTRYSSKGNDKFHTCQYQGHCIANPRKNLRRKFNNFFKRSSQEDLIKERTRLFCHYIISFLFFVYDIFFIQKPSMFIVPKALTIRFDPFSSGTKIFTIRPTCTGRIARYSCHHLLA